MKNFKVKQHQWYLARVWFVIVLSLLLPHIALARIPNDPLVAQWSYKDTGVYAAWDEATGSERVVVAIIDNGFDTFHPDLGDNVWRNLDEVPLNGIDDDANGYVDDVWGWSFVPIDSNGDGTIDESERHGNNDPRPSVFAFANPNERDVVHHATLIAGIIGALGDNGQAGAGINWHVKLMNVKVVDNTGTGELTRLPQAIRYAVDNGAHVINLSLVGGVDTNVAEAVKYAYDHGVAVIAAAGNDLVNLNDVQRYPVCADAGQTEKWVLGVSAIGESHRIAAFSNIGSSCIDITAPGANISSTLRYAPAYELSSLFGGSWRGTSFATPFVSGAIALIKSIHPEWGPTELYHAVLSTVHKTPPKDEAEYAMLFGAGLIQIDKAVVYAKTQVRQGHPLTSLSFTSLKNGATEVWSRSVHADTSTRVSVSPPRNAQAVTPFQVLGEERYAAIVSQKKGVRIISELIVADREFRVLTRTSLAGSGPWRIVVADMMGDTEPEIVVAPRGADTTVLRVFSLAGKEIRHWQISKKHRGVMVGFAPPDANKKSELLAVYDDGRGVVLRHLNADLTVVRDIPLPFLQRIGQSGVGDVDGDGVDEYIVGTGSGEESLITILAADGTIVRQFTAYPSDYRGGLSLAVGDYDNDGKDNIIVSPLTGRQPIRVWSDRARVTHEWWLQGDGDAGAVEVSPRFVEPSI